MSWDRPVTTQEAALAALEAAQWNANDEGLSGANIWGVCGLFAAEHATSFFTYEIAKETATSWFEMQARAVRDSGKQGGEGDQGMSWHNQVRPIGSKSTDGGDSVNAQQIVNFMINTEASGKLDADELVVIRDARLALQAAAQSGDGERIKARMGKAKEVLKLWDHKLPAA